MTPTPEANGRILIEPCYDGEGNVTEYNFEWVGGDMIAFSTFMLEDSVPELISVEGNVVTIGPYKLQVIERRAETWLARRIREGESSDGA